MKKTRKAGAWLLTAAMTISTFAYAAPATVQAADPFSGSLSKVDSAEADGNVVEISFNDGAVTGRITFLENECRSVRRVQRVREGQRRLSRHRKDPGTA